jgi:hypothetical protein
MSSPTTLQTTLLTSHKGVDLHAATSLLVMKDRLDGGHLLEVLFRCEMHTFWGEEGGLSMARLLDVGRYFNPNKHHYGHFEMAVNGPSWLGEAPSGEILDPLWPGSPEGTDLEPTDGDGGDLYDRLLGGAAADGLTAVDVVSYPQGQEGPVLSGVLWRLVIRGDKEASLEVGKKLAVASHRKEGLLVNPHMECWQAAAR